MNNFPFYPTYPRPSQEKTLDEKLNSFNALLEVNHNAIRIYQDINAECVEPFSILHAIYAERLAEEFSTLFADVMERENLKGNQGGEK